MIDTLLINSVDKTSYLQRPSAVIDKMSDNRSSAYFSLIMSATDLGTNDGLIVGQDVKFKDGTTVIFGGVIKAINIFKYESGLGSTKKLRVDVSCEDYNNIPSRRVTSSYFTDTDAGTIVEAMVDDVLGLTGFDDGVTQGTINTGATINVYSVNAKTVKEVLDDMAEASGYKWYIDETKALNFVQDDTVSDATYDLVETAATFEDFNVVNVKITTDNYRNKQWVLGAVDEDGSNVNVSATDSAEISARATAEGGSGVYGNIIRATESQTVTDADVVASNGIKVYGKMPYKITFTSFTNSWNAGERLLCNLPTVGISDDTYFLIESVTIEDLGTVFWSTVTATRRDATTFSTQRTETFDDYFAKIIKSINSNSGTGNASMSGRVADIATTELPISLSTTTVSRTFEHDFPDVVDILTTLTLEYTATADVTLTIVYKDGATTDYTFPCDLPSGSSTYTLTIPEIEHTSGEHTFTIDMTASADSVLQLDNYLLYSRWEKYRDSYTDTSDTDLGYGEYELLADIEVTSATTSVDITGLSLDSDDEILLVSDIDNVTASSSSISAYINSNNTDTNYYHQRLLATSTTIVANRFNNGTIIFAEASDRTIGMTNINLIENGYYTYQSDAVGAYDTTAPTIRTRYGTSTFTISSITSITIASAIANAIGIGSRFWLYKKGSA